MNTSNYDLYEIRHNIMALFARAEVTPAVAYFIIKDVYVEIEQLYQAQVNKEMQFLQQKEAEEEQQQETIEYHLDADANINKEDLNNEESHN